MKAYQTSDVTREEWLIWSKNTVPRLWKCRHFLPGWCWSPSVPQTAGAYFCHGKGYKGYCGYWAVYPMYPEKQVETECCTGLYNHHRHQCVPGCHRSHNLTSFKPILKSFPAFNNLNSGILKWNENLDMTYCLPSRESGHAKSQNWLCAFSCEGHSALRLDLHNLNYNVTCRSQHEVKKRWKFKLQRFEDRLPTLNLCLKLISALWATYLSRGPHCSILRSVHKFQHDLIVTWRAPLNDTDSNKNNSALMGHEEVPGRKEGSTNNKLFLPEARLARLAFWQPSHSFHTTLWLFDAITQLSQLCAQKWLWPRQEKQFTWLHCHDHLAFAFWTSKETQFLQIVWVCDVLVCLPLQILQPINCIKTYYQK